MYLDPFAPFYKTDFLRQISASKISIGSRIYTENLLNFRTKRFDKVLPDTMDSFRSIPVLFSRDIECGGRFISFCSKTK